MFRAIQSVCRAGIAQPPRVQTTMMLAPVALIAARNFAASAQTIKKPATSYALVCVYVYAHAFAGLSLLPHFAMRERCGAVALLVQSSHQVAERGISSLAGERRRCPQ